MPRPIDDVLRGVVEQIAPADPLSKLQAAWPQIAGSRDAAYSQPVRQLGDGTIVIRCDSAALAAELQLRERQLTALAQEFTELQVTLKFQGPRGRG